MNGFKLTADSYRVLLDRFEKSGEDTTDVKRRIRVNDFLATCDKDDFCCLFDSGAFNDIVRAYVSRALDGARLEYDVKQAVMGGLGWLFDTMGASSV